MKNRKDSDTISNMRRKTHKGVDKIIDKAEDFEQGTKENLVNLNENVTKVRENINGYIKDNPEKSILITAGISAVIGAILITYIMRRR